PWSHHIVTRGGISSLRFMLQPDNPLKLEIAGCATLPEVYARRTVGKRSKLALAFRPRSKGEPCSKSRKFFVTRPRRTMRAAKFGNPSQKCIWLETKGLCGAIQELPLL